ncbi:MAG: MerR family transcriptional regulator [Acidobacteriota bacterium]
MRNAGYTIRTMAARCGMTTHTLRYYERVGLIQPVDRAQNGHRRYSDADEAWLKFLHCMRNTNMPIREMQRYARLREDGAASSLERRKILEEHRATVASQIAALEKAHALLSQKIANYRNIEERIGVAKPAGTRAESDRALAAAAS